MSSTHNPGRVAGLLYLSLDLYQTTPSLIAALAGAALALGIVFWLVSNREEPQEVEAQERFVAP